MFIAEVIKNIFIVWISLFFIVREMNFFLAIILATIIINIGSFLILSLLALIINLWGKLLEKFRKD